jgi:hypothetical protein
VAESIQSKELVAELRAYAHRYGHTERSLPLQAAARIEYLERCRCELRDVVERAIQCIDHKYVPWDVDKQLRSALSRCAPAIEREQPSMCDPMNDPSSALQSGEGGK